MTADALPTSGAWQQEENSGEISDVVNELACMSDSTIMLLSTAITDHTLQH